MSKDDSPVVQIDEELKTSNFMMETKNFQKYLLNFFIIIKRALQKNSGVRHVIRDFVSTYRKGFQSVS